MSIPFETLTSLHGWHVPPAISLLFYLFMQTFSFFIFIMQTYLFLPSILIKHHFWPFLVVGMATGRVRVGFLCTRTRLAGLTLKLEPAPFIKRVFFSKPKPALSGLAGPATSGPIRGLIQKKNFAWIFKPCRTENITTMQTKVKSKKILLNATDKSLRP